MNSRLMSTPTRPSEYLHESYKAIDWNCGPGWPAGVGILGGNWAANPTSQLLLMNDQFCPPENALSEQHRKSIPVCISKTMGWENHTTVGLFWLESIL